MARLCSLSLANCCPRIFLLFASKSVSRNIQKCEKRCCPVIVPGARFLGAETTTNIGLRIIRCFFFSSFFLFIFVPDTRFQMRTFARCVISRRRDRRCAILRRVKCASAIYHRFGGSRGLVRIAVVADHAPDAGVSWYRSHSRRIRSKQSREREGTEKQRKRDRENEEKASERENSGEYVRISWNYNCRLIGLDARNVVMTILCKALQGVLIDLQRKVTFALMETWRLVDTRSVKIKRYMIFTIKHTNTQERSKEEKNARHKYAREITQHWRKQRSLEYKGHCVCIK